MTSFLREMREVVETADLNAITAKQNTVIFFWAAWHEPSKQGGQMDLVFAEIHKKHGESIAFVKIEAEQAAEISAFFEVAVVPTFMFLKTGGEIVDKLEGANAPALAERIESFATIVSVPGATATKDEESEPDLNTRLVKLISAAPTMLFMKGSPSEPRCGFSRTFVELLSSNGIEFGSFDILQDDDVRQGLKVFSNWPTYPQLYVKGELVGGLDILKEMLEEEGSLAEQLGLEGSPESAAGAATPDLSLDERCSKVIHQAPVMLFMKGDPDAPQCGFSRTMVSLLQDASVEFQSFDILGDEEIRQHLKVYSKWPTYPQLYVNGELIGGIDILKEMAADTTSPLSTQLGLQSLEDRLRQLTSRSKVMLFMKGTPSAPECGFSSTIVQMLQEAQCSFDSFDILQDPDVRAGLKKFSDWPTFPQVYVSGEFIGGLDIMKELKEADELSVALKLGGE
mmetsp:Transcript_16805/g.22579  ORF Transcript_16805/g.22579 Transcript_16805/m.22579 type:complete len:454 (-) Transcript_16805:198-1559(-)